MDPNCLGHSFKGANWSRASFHRWAELPSKHRPGLRGRSVLNGAKTPQHTGPSQVDQIRAAKFEKMNKARFGSSESSEGSGRTRTGSGAATPGTVPLRSMRRAEAGGPLDRRSVDEEEKRVRQRPSSERCGWVHAPGGSREA